MKQREFNFDSEDFARMRYVINEEMGKVIRALETKRLTSGSVSITINIGKMEETDEDGTIRNIYIFDPKIGSKIGQKFKAKCNAIGGEISIGKDGELLVGPSNQVTIDELMRA